MRSTPILYTKYRGRPHIFLELHGERLWFLYEIECKILGTTSYKKSLFEVTPYAFVRNGHPCTKWLLFEMVFVRSDLTPTYIASFVNWMKRRGASQIS